MAGNTDVYDQITNTPGTPANSFEVGLDVKRLGATGFTNIPDITDLNPVSTPKTRGRETYASKGNSRASKYAEDLTTTVNIEIVRDDAGQWQPELVDLVKAARSLGAANRRAYRVYDLKGADYQFEAIASIGMAFSGTGWDDSKWATITFSPYSAANWDIPNPVNAGVIPTISQVLPATAAAGATVVIQGDMFSAATAVKFGAVAASSFQILSDNTITAVVPAGTTATSYPVTVTSANGTSVAAPWTHA